MFRRIFGKRKGGSPFGKLLRLGVKSATGISIPTPKKDGKWVREMKAQGKLPALEKAVEQGRTIESITNEVSTKKNASMMEKVKGFFSNTKTVVFSLVVVVGAVWYFFMKPKRGRRRRR